MKPVTELRDQVGSDVALLYVVDDEDERAEGEAFLTEWTADQVDMGGFTSPLFLDVLRPTEDALRGSVRN